METQIIICGLGRMGGQIVRRLKAHNFDVIGFDPLTDAVAKIQQENISATTDLGHACTEKNKQRVFWLMMPHEVIDDFLSDNKLGQYLIAGDIIIDGGNSFYEDTMRRAAILQSKNISYFDCGTSGGLAGEKEGFSLMIGGPKEVWPTIETIFQALAYTDGYAYLGSSGAGHFVKMVHNGIEYGMMEAIGEGYAVLAASPFNLNLSDVSKVYQHGSIISSHLIDLTKEIFDAGGVGDTSGVIDATGEGEWTIHAAEKLGVPVSVIAESFAVRKRSHDATAQNSFSNKVVALLRKKFGGHATHTNEPHE